MTKEIGALKSVDGKLINEIIERLRDKYPKVLVYEKFVTTRFGNNLEVFASIPYPKIKIETKKAIIEKYDIVDESLRQEINELLKQNKSIDEIVNYLEKTKIDVFDNKINKSIETITDSSIQKILLNHLENYKWNMDEDNQIIAPQTLAFSPDGVKELNANIVALNNGKFHHPIYKVRTSDAMGTKFSVSEEGTKSNKFVVTAAGSNAFCGFYQNGKDRKFYIPTLRESVQNLKDGYEPCPATHPDDLDFKLIFVLNPSDLVYVPTEEENENFCLIDFTKLNNEQKTRIYKFTDGSGTTMNFVPTNIASLLLNMSNKDQEKAGIKLTVQNELGLGSPQSKNQNSIDGTQIKSVCWKLKIDRLGNISKT
mgnify:CR=1 FL=1